MINGYQKYTKEPNTICNGSLVLTKTFHFETKNDFKERLVRVYLPSTYDFSNPSKRFKTIYMLDGKNLFDDYTSFVGEWGIDESIEKMIQEGKSEGYIVIGIDAPNENIARSQEMSPDGMKRYKKYEMPGSGYASILGNFIFNIVKKDIDETFFTKPEKEFTGVGGSSMGGIMAFYLGMEYPNQIGYCLNFSPAFFLFDWDEFKNYLVKKVNHSVPKQFFYVGGKGFEKQFVEATFRTYNYFMSCEFSHDDVKLIYDSENEHNEQAWGYYFPIALTSIDK